jgi:hypothetical protein
MIRMREEDLIPIESLEEIPVFANEDEEADFWSTHSFGEKLLEQMRPLDDVLPVRRRRRRRVTMAVANHSRVIPIQRAKPRSDSRRGEIVIHDHAWRDAS